MAKLQVTTESAEKVWESPDGQRIIFRVTMDWKGKRVVAKTYSRAIAKEGFSGEVETYEKEGKRGVEIFVKQPPKEGFTGGSTSSEGRKSGSGYQPKDEKAIQAMWAIDKAKDLTIAYGKFKETTPIDEVFSSIEAYAQGLFNMVDRVKETPEDIEVTEEEEPLPEPPEDLDKNLTIDDVKKVFDE